MPNLTAPAADADTGAARDEGSSLHTVADAVAELERREHARRAQRKADQAKDDDADDDADTDTDDGDEGDDDAPTSKPKAKSKPKAQADDDSEGEDDDEPKKRKAKADDEDEDDAEESDADEQEEGDDDGADDDADKGEDDDKPAKKAKQPERVRIRLADDREVDATPDEVSQYVQEAVRERTQTAAARQQLQQHSQQLIEQGQILAQFAQALVGSEPDLQLAQTDLPAYTVQKELHRQRVQALQALMGRTQQAAQQAQQQHQQVFAQFVQREQQALLKAVPDLADPAKLAAFSGRVAKVAQRYGFTAQEMQQAHDHRIYLMLRDLGRLADIDAGERNTRKQLKKAPPVKVPEQRAQQGQRRNAGASDKNALKAFLKSDRSMRSVRDYIDRTSR